MNRPTKKKYLLLRVISYLLKFLLLVFLIYAVLRNDWLWSFFVGIMIIIAFLPILIKRILGIDFLWLFDIFVSLALLFHIGNGLLDICSSVPLYNKFTHFFSAMVVGFLILLLLFVTNQYYQGIVGKRSKVLFDVVVITMAFGVVWEFLEWSSDLLFGWHTQPSLQDTMGDLLADALGGIVIAFLGYFLLKRNVLQRYSQTIKRELDALFEKK